MLELRPSCECCDVDLPYDSPLARICTFECTFCATCAERKLSGWCPNCGGELLPRPRRPAASIVANPASTVRVFKPAGCQASTAGGSPARAAFPVTVRRLVPGDSTLLEPLCSLLIDTVHSGASVGFLAPLTRESAQLYWGGVLAALGDGLLLWVAESRGLVVGSVQLACCDKDNGRHRGEVRKLLVLTEARGLGIASRLMQAAEAAARIEGRTLLVLDTLLGSHAENVYRHLGWQRAGEIPAFAAAPDGELFPTVYYFKQLES